MNQPFPPSEPQNSPSVPSEPPVEAPGPHMVRVKRPSTKPTVTYTIMGITIFVYLLQQLSGFSLVQAPLLALSRLVFGDSALQALLANGWGNELLVLLGGKINPLIEAGQYWRLLTPALLHASLVHIGFNMYALFAIGPSLEVYYGHTRFLILYLVGALGGNVLSFLMTQGLSVGASTAIFGLVAAEGTFIYQNRRVFGPQARTMLTNVLVVIVINLALGFTASGIDNFGHLGGLIAGLAFGWFAGPKLEVAFKDTEFVLEDHSRLAAAWFVGILIAVIFFAVAYLRVLQKI